MFGWEKHDLEMHVFAIFYFLKFDHRFAPFSDSVVKCVIALSTS